MIITHKKGIKYDGKNPTILYGYGGFNISLTPSFSILNAFWMDQGGVYAVPNLRGGGEFGKEWHLAGTKMNKKGTEKQTMEQKRNKKGTKKEQRKIQRQYQLCLDNYLKR